jgi:hypothetical protein
LRIVGVIASVEADSVTTRFTAITTGVPMPVIVKSTAALYWPTARLVGFTRTLIVAGNAPLFGLAVTQNVFAGAMAVVYVGAPALAFTEIVCAAGSEAAPDWYVNVKIDGVVVIVCACSAQARTPHAKSILPTPGLSAHAEKL